jgi:hypothetical protein
MQPNGPWVTGEFKEEGESTGVSLSSYETFTGSGLS